MTRYDRRPRNPELSGSATSGTRSGEPGVNIFLLKRVYMHLSTSSQSKLASGTSKLASGTSKLASGTSKLASGTSKLASGTSKLASGTSGLASRTSGLEIGPRLASVPRFASVLKISALALAAAVAFGLAGPAAAQQTSFGGF